MKVKSWIKQIEDRKTAIGKERDKLNEMISDAEDLRECCQKAYEDLQSAQDYLSELI